MYRKRKVWTFSWLTAAWLGAGSAVAAPETPVHLGGPGGEVGPPRVCEASSNSGLPAADCSACALYQSAMAEVPDGAVHFEGVLLEDGVALRATTTEPEVQERLWAVSVARNDLLERAHLGQSTNLCAACLANVRSFDEVQFGIERIPNGVMLVYTSSSADLVRLLQVLLLSHELPL